MLIYKVTNLQNGKVYIGQTGGTLEYRRNKHEKESLNENRKTVYFHNALIKYGFDNFKWEIIKDNIQTQKELDDLEIYYIDFYKSANKEFGYNLKLGGKFGGIFNEEARKNLGESTKRKWENPEIAARMKVGLEKATERWKEISKENRIKHICPVCGKEFETANWDSHKYCSLECANKDLKDVALSNLEKANQVNKEKYQKHKEEKIPQIKEWVKNNSHFLKNVKWNKLTFIQELCDYINVKDHRTVAKLLGVSNKRDLVKKLIEINEKICQTSLN